jgi:hypothetical protein
VTAEGTSERPQHEVPYLHVRPPRRIVGVGGEGIPLARIVGNRPVQMGEACEPERPDYSRMI